MGKGRGKAGLRHPIDVRVGERIRMRRMILNLSQIELAHRIGTSFQAIQKYERARSRVAASVLYRLATALGVDANYFVFEGPEGAPSGQIIETEVFLLRALQQLRDLPGPVQEAMLRLIQCGARTFRSD